jgi:hypothetical protein
MVGWEFTFWRQSKDAAIAHKPTIRKSYENDEPLP